MKLIPTLACVCMCACAPQHITQPRQPDLDLYRDPPNTTTLVINDTHTVSRTELKEWAVYAQSIATIDCTMKAEQQMLNTGKATRDELCKVDTLVDSRGGQHFKPYCITK